MAQKLSAVKYVKNNKRRVSVLIVSLGLCFALVYITQFLLSSTEETFRQIASVEAEKVQYISLSADTLGIGGAQGEELNALYAEKLDETAEKLKSRSGIKEVYRAPVAYFKIQMAVGEFAQEMPMLPREDIPAVLEHIGAELSEGRLPETDGEVVLSGSVMKNRGYEIGGVFNYDYYGDDYTIVGSLDYDGYFGCGICKEDGVDLGERLVVLSEGINDMSAVLKEEGIETDEKKDVIVDRARGERVLKEEITDVIDGATTYVYVGIMLLLFISLAAVYAAYLRDRREEWCLYCSIGYSRAEIYFSIQRELLFTFVSAVIFGGAVIAVLLPVLDLSVIKPLGLRVKYFHPKTLGEIFCTYALLFGLLQIPVRSALYRIRTADAFEDDLY